MLKRKNNDLDLTCIICAHTVVVAVHARVHCLHGHLKYGILKRGEKKDMEDNRCFRYCIDVGGGFEMSLCRLH